MALLRRVYYYRTRNGREVDFVWKSEDEQMLFVQVSEAIPPGSDARAREVKSLVEALNEQPGSRGVIVTMDSEELIETEAGNIEVVPAWRYLLEV